MNQRQQENLGAAALVGAFLIGAAACFWAFGQLTSTKADAQGSPTVPLPVTGITAVPTYSGAVVGLANTGAGDIYCVTGAPTASGKIVRVKGFRVSAVATAGIDVDINVILRSTLDTGGTSANVPLVAHDQTNPTASGTATSYSVAPTPGTAIGTVRTQKDAVGTPGNTVNTALALFQFSVYYGQALTLRLPTQAACVNVSAGGAGSLWDVDHEHSEENL